MKHSLHNGFTVAPGNGTSFPSQISTTTAGPPWKRETTIWVIPHSRPDNDAPEPINWSADSQ